MCKKKKKLILVVSGVLLVMIAVALTVIHFQHQKIWNTYQQAVSQEDVAHASMLELTEELDALIVDEQTCLSRVNNPDVCTASIELSQKAHETAKKTDRMESIVQPKAWIYSPSLLEKLYAATKQEQSYEKECLALNEELETQIENLEAAYLDKALTDYTSAVADTSASVDALQSLIDSTTGAVADEATRQDAQTSVTDTHTILDTEVDEANLDELRTATTHLKEQQAILGEKSAAITASHKAYQQAQAEAAAAAAAEAERAAQKYKSYGSSSGGSSNNNNNSGSSSASSSGGGSDDTPATWDIPDYLNEGRDVPLPEGFIPYG